MRSDRDKLLDILEALDNIGKYASRGKTSFSGNELVQIWMVYHLQIIGEAARALSDHIREHHPEVPWPEIIGLRNLLVHHYFGIDLEVIWGIITNDLPPFRRQVEAILRELGGP